MSPTAISSCIFVSVTVAIISLGALIFDFFLRTKSRVDERIKEAFRDKLRSQARESSLFPELLAQSSGAVQKQRLRDRLHVIIEQSGLGLNTTHVASICVLGALFVGSSAGLLSRSLIVAGISAICTVLGLVMLVLKARQRRRALLCRQLPEAFDTMSRALRSGQTVPAAFQMVANEFPKPIAEEFALCYEQQHLGIEYEVALRDLARRTGLIETQIFVVALIVNRQTGGNLAELLDGLAGTMRKREKFKGRLRGLTGEGRMQAAVLIALPILAMLCLWLMDRSYAQLLLDRPKLLIGTGISVLLGAICIQRIVNFEI